MTTLFHKLFLKTIYLTENSYTTVVVKTYRLCLRQKSLPEKCIMLTTTTAIIIIIIMHSLCSKRAVQGGHISIASVSEKFTEPRIFRPTDHITLRYERNVGSGYVGNSNHSLRYAFFEITKGVFCQKRGSDEAYKSILTEDLVKAQDFLKMQREKTDLL